MTTELQDTEPSDDTVEALEMACEKYLFGRAAGNEIRTDSKVMASILTENLSKLGYTLRRETMTEAELAEEALDISIGNRVGGRSHKHIIDLAKKYRGV